MIISATGFESGEITECLGSSSSAIVTDAATGLYAAQVDAGGWISFAVNDSAVRQPRVFNFAMKRVAGDTGDVDIRLHYDVSSYYDITFAYDTTAHTYGVVASRNGAPITGGSYYIYQSLPETFLLTGVWERLDICIDPNNAIVVLINNYPEASIISYQSSEPVVPNPGFTYFEIRPSTKPVLVDDVVVYDKPFTTDSSPYSRDTYQVRVFPMRVAGEVLADLAADGSSASATEALLSSAAVGTHYISGDTIGKTYHNRFILENWTPPNTLTGVWSEWSFDTWTFNYYTSPIVAGMMITAVAKGSSVTARGTVSMTLSNGQGYSFSSLVPHALALDYAAYSDIAWSNIPVMSWKDFQRSSDALQADIYAANGASANEIRVTRLVTCLIAFVKVSDRRLVGDGGFDLSFDWSPSCFGSGCYGASVSFLINTSIVKGIVAEDASCGSTKITLKYGDPRSNWTEGVLNLIAESYPNPTVRQTYIAPESGTPDGHFRILFHDRFLSIYVNNQWRHTFCFDQISYPGQTTLAIASDTEENVYQVTVRELSDWREAVWIDYEQTGDSAISSIIQERPLETIACTDGEIAYYAKRAPVDLIVPKYINQHSFNTELNRDAGSDALVYYSDVIAITDDDYLEEWGFSTRILQLSNLDNGARRAAQTILHRANESIEKHDVQARANLTIEEGDLVRVGYTRSGTGSEGVYDIIVESCEISFTPESMKMKMSGRRYLP